jgi:hypothetical protein
MNRFLICLISLLLILSCNCEPRESNARDNAIIAQVLELECEGCLFTVVDPMTDTLQMFHLPEKFMADGHEFAPLIKKLIKKNKKPVRLTLESSFVNSYVIADIRKFEKLYFYGICRFYRLLNIYPPLYRQLGISLPVYDEKEGIVLIYSGGGGFLIGRGDLIFYRLEDGKLREIDRLMLWIS